MLYTYIHCLLSENSRSFLMMLVCLSTLQHNFVSASPHISCEVVAAMAWRWMCLFTSSPDSGALLYTQGMWNYINTAPARAVEKWDIQMKSSPKTHHGFLERQQSWGCPSALLPRSKIRRELLTLVVSLWLNTLTCENKVCRIKVNYA